MNNGNIAREITRVMWRINPRELESVLDSMDASEVAETVRQFNQGVDFFSTPAGKKFYKNGKRRDHGSEEDRKVREGEDPSVDGAQAGEDAVRGQERKGGGAMERGLVADTPGARGGGGVGAGPDRVEEPQWWVFTFGMGHEHAGHYVRIHGTFSEARAEMVRRFGRWWAFQYSQDEWERTVRSMRSMGWPVETELKEEEDD